jgi:uncharacterized membrane protein YhhN
MLPAILFTLICVAALLVAEYRGSRRGVWLTKPLASAGFIATALAAGALESGYGRSILVALVFSWFGDVFLIPRGTPRIFKAGVLSFLLAHLVFAGAFLGLEINPPSSAGALLIALALGLLVFRWLRPHLTPEIRGAAYAYLVVISAMLVSAAGTLGNPRGPAILVGAAMFYTSDLSVARDRFIASTFWNRAWGLPLYFGGQLFLASSAA